MAERLTLTTPITPPAPTTTDYVVRSLYLGWEEALIQVVLRDNNGHTLPCTYEGPPATALMIALNKANLTNNSLHKRIINQLTTDGKVPAGAVTGAPD